MRRFVTIEWWQVFLSGLYWTRYGRSLPWRESPPGSGLLYRDASTYVDWQSAKLPHVFREPRFSKYASVIVERYQSAVRPQTSILCLGARHGGEVEGFRRLGLLAVGLDLNPGDDRLVLRGNMQTLPFPDRTFDAVFTNSLDHISIPVEQVVREWRRVLKIGGRLILELSNGSADDPPKEPKEFESFWWRRIEGVIDVIREGFVTIKSFPIAYPFQGRSVILENTGCLRNTWNDPDQRHL